MSSNEDDKADIKSLDGIEEKRENYLGIDSIPDTIHEKNSDKDITKAETGDGTQTVVSSTSDDVVEEAIEPEEIARVRSTTSSILAPGAVVISRENRRGLFGRITIIPEVDNASRYSNTTKWMLTAVVALAGCAAPMGSSIFYPALPQISKDLHATSTVTNLSVAMYMISMSIFPLWWSSFSETLGRRTIYLVSFSLFVLFNILSALSTSISMLIVMRILGGGASASVQAVGAGTIADLWEPRERGRAMGIFYLGPLMGPLLAPIFGGALTEGFGWRSTQWFLVIYGGILLVLLVFCLPETLLRPLQAAHSTRDKVSGSSEKDKGGNRLTHISTRQSAQIRTQKAARFFKRSIIDPLSVLAYLRFPAVLLTVYYASITFGSLYMLNISVQQTFSNPPYSYSTIIVGLLYVPNSLGYVLVSILGGKWIDSIMAREARRAGRYDARGHLIYIPEDRMRENAWIAAVLYPGALLWYGWTVQKDIFWLVPMIANFFFGVGSMLVFSMATTMLTEFMPKRSSSGVAINNFVRNIFSCVGSIVASPLIDAIGNGWLFTGLAVIAWVSGAAVIWAIGRYGPKWRERMTMTLNGE